LRLSFFHAEKLKTFRNASTPLTFVTELYRRNVILVHFALAPAKSDADFKRTLPAWVVPVDAAFATSVVAETLQAAQKPDVDTCDIFPRNLTDRTGGYASRL
jgi:hypothetical protein